MSKIEEGFYDCVQVRTTSGETGEELWFHWDELAEIPVLVTRIKIVGGEFDGQTLRKQLWFDGDTTEKGGEKRAWDALEAFGYTGNDLMELEHVKCWGGQVRASIYENKNGYMDVGWIGKSGGTTVKTSATLSPGDKARFAAQVKARRGTSAPAPAPAPATSRQPWDNKDDIPF